MTDKDDEALYADEVILKIKNQLIEYGQASSQKDRETVPILELEVLSFFPQEVEV